MKRDKEVVQGDRPFEDCLVPMAGILVFSRVLMMQKLAQVQMANQWISLNLRLIEVFMTTAFVAMLERGYSDAFERGLVI